MTLKTLTASAMLALTLAIPAKAQDADALARQYVAMPEVQRMMDDMFAPASMFAQFKAGLPPNIELNKDQETRIGQLLSEAMVEMKPQMETLMAEGAARNFTADELGALIAFYQSEHGASVMSKMQPYMQDVMGQLMPQVLNTMQSVGPQIVKIIQEG